jgi:hypothetical protein
MVEILLYVQSEYGSAKAIPGDGFVTAIELS